MREKTRKKERKKEGLRCAMVYANEESELELKSGIMRKKKNHVTMKGKAIWCICRYVVMQ